MATFPGLYAVPGAAWPGSIWPADVISAFPASVSPVLFSVGYARNGSGFAGRTLFQPATSSPFLQVQVIATLDGAAYNPTSDTVALAFVATPAYGSPPNPTSGQWQPATWETDSGGAGPVYWASILTGPSGFPLTAGPYNVAVQVTDGGVPRVMWGCILIVT